MFLKKLRLNLAWHCIRALIFLDFIMVCEMAHFRYSAVCVLI